MTTDMRRIFLLIVALMALPVLSVSADRGEETISWNSVKPASGKYSSLLSDKESGYSAVIPTPVGFVLVGDAAEGGGNPVTGFTRADGSSKKMPELPVRILQPYGTTIDNSLIISGIPADGSRAAIYRLDLGAPQNGWKQTETLPGTPRGNAAISVQNNGANSCIYIIGGVSADGKKLKDGYVYDTILRKWKKISGNMPAGIHAAASTGANHLLLAGRDSAGNTLIYRFHTITSTITPGETTGAKAEKIYALSKGSDGSLSLLGRDADGKAVELDGAISVGDRSMGFVNWLVIVLYFVVLAGIGVYFARKQKNTDDYFKGGGRIPWWAAGLSLFGTALSAITFMAIPAKAFCTDWSYALFNVGIVLVAPVIVWVFIPYFRKLNITTAYQYLEIRFNAVIRVLCSLAFIIFQVGRMGVVLFLPSIALNVVTGMDIFVCIGIMGICSIIYTMTGGIEAVVWTDALQVIILLGGALFAVIYIICEIPGGFSETMSIAVADNKFSLGSINLDLRDSTVWTVLIAAFFTNLTTYGTDQSMVQRYLTTPTEGAAKKSVWTNALLTIPATIVFFFIGTALYAYYKTFPTEMSVTVNSSDAIFPWYIFTKLPTGVVGLLISGIFAAAMSTLSGSMNSAATAYIVDIYPRISRKKAGSLRTARIATCVIGVISLLFAFLMATWNIASLWDEFQKLLGLILGSMGGLFILGMITKRANSGGAIIGIIVSIFVQLFVAKFHTLHLLLYTTSGFISCFVVGYLASFLFPQSKKKIAA